MKEKTPFRIVGGKDSKAENTTKDEETLSAAAQPMEKVSFRDVPGALIAQEYSDPEVEELVQVFATLILEVPKNFNDGVTKDLLEQDAREVKGMSTKQLLAYLSRHDVWHRPSSTTAVLDEVAYRIVKQDFSTRK